MNKTGLYKTVILSCKICIDTISRCDECFDALDPEKEIYCNEKEKHGGGFVHYHYHKECGEDIIKREGGNVEKVETKG